MASSDARLVRECRVPAASSALRAVRRHAEAAALDFGFGRRERYAFVFAVNEAATNAIRHGRPDARGTIGMRFDAEGDTLVCSISDSGCFNLAYDGEIGPMAESGRGFRLMSELTDQVELSSTPCGTTVRLHKRRPVETSSAGG
ncbi:MAG TPA: ATP-binding protein [Solirubrobacteraceae bacterium]|nr:ATP-binding protein [Solirubrobacteraceae bacterium]